MQDEGVTDLKNLTKRTTKIVKIIWVVYNLRNITHVMKFLKIITFWKKLFHFKLIKSKNIDILKNS